MKNKPSHVSRALPPPPSAHMHVFIDICNTICTLAVFVFGSCFCQAHLQHIPTTAVVFQAFGVDVQIVNPYFNISLYNIICIYIYIISIVDWLLLLVGQPGHSRCFSPPVTGNGYLPMFQMFLPSFAGSLKSWWTGNVTIMTIIMISIMISIYLYIYI